MLRITFEPESKSFISATKEYQDIWAEEGTKILDVFKQVTSLQFQQKSIEAIIYEGPSFSGNLNEPMKLRASYPLEEKQGTLVHELGHRLIAPLHNRMENIDEHRTLNLFLYDVWINLYGKDFADSMIAIEKERKGLYDYEGAWNWFLNLDNDEKLALWQKFLSLNRD